MLSYMQGFAWSQYGAKYFALCEAYSQFFISDRLVRSLITSLSCDTFKAFHCKSNPSLLDVGPSTCFFEMFYSLYDLLLVFSEDILYFNLCLRKDMYLNLFYFSLCSVMKVSCFFIWNAKPHLLSLDCSWSHPCLLSTYDDISLCRSYAVYDITISYKHRCPCFIDNVFGVDPSEVHLHVQRILPHEIPTSENEVTAWLIERFRLKDQLLSDFLTRGYFPHQGTEGDLSTPTCLVKCFVVITMTSIFIYLTLFSSGLFKFYVLPSFTYLTIVTYFGIQPQPVLGSLKGLFCGKKAY